MYAYFILITYDMQEAKQLVCFFISDIYIDRMRKFISLKSNVSVATR